jgi:hypothetical protein
MLFHAIQGAGGAGGAETSFVSSIFEYNNTGTANLPANLAVGDLVIFDGWAQGATSLTITTSGWTSIHQGATYIGNAGRIAMYYKVMTQTDIDNGTVSGESPGATTGHATFVAFRQSTGTFSNISATWLGISSTDPYTRSSSTGNAILGTSFSILVQQGTSSPPSVGSDMPTSPFTFTTEPSVFHSITRAPVIGGYATGGNPPYFFFYQICTRAYGWLTDTNSVSIGNYATSASYIIEYE